MLKDSIGFPQRSARIPRFISFRKLFEEFRFAIQFESLIVSKDVGCPFEMYLFNVIRNKYLDAWHAKRCKIASIELAISSVCPWWLQFRLSSFSRQEQNVDRRRCWPPLSTLQGTNDERQDLYFTVSGIRRIAAVDRNRLRSTWMESELPDYEHSWRLPYGL